jgi:hypothetical protein
LSATNVCEHWPMSYFSQWAQTVMPEETVPAGELPDHRCGRCNSNRKPYGFCGYEHGPGAMRADYCAETGTLYPWRNAEPVFVPPKAARAPRPKMNRQLTFDEPTKASI